jgi:muramoyltetrapeptide carboxypeptidase LdcA involved in peptidoglycan recycling
MNKVLIDESITGAFVVSNGKGYIQLINNLDEEIIKTNPIWLFGVGDSTYLQLYFHQLGISSVYGGQINGQISELTDNELINIYRNILSDNTTGNLYLEETITQAPTRSNKGEQVDNEPVQGSTWGVRLKEYPGFYL